MNELTIGELCMKTGANEYHGSASIPVEDENVTNGQVIIDNTQLRVTSREKVAQMKRILAQMK